MRLLGKTTVRPINWWRDDRCAKAFWTQSEIPAYQKLLAETVEWLDPRPGERWIDLGCGGGRLTRALWHKSKGQIGEVIGLDCAALNAVSFEKMQRTLLPTPGQRLRFEQVDFSSGLPWDEENLFDGAVSGLAIQYAESYSDAEDRWTQDAYDRLLQDIQRTLKPGASFVFSVNVPEPSWGRAAAEGSIRGIFATRRKIRYLSKLLRMYRYGAWLKREARKGRFHYLPAESIAAKLADAGFIDIEHRMSYANQAFIFRCRKG